MDVAPEEGVLSVRGRVPVERWSMLAARMTWLGNSDCVFCLCVVGHVWYDGFGIFVSEI